MPPSDATLTLRFIRLKSYKHLDPLADALFPGCCHD